MNLFFHIVGPFVVLIILNYKVHTRIKEFEKTLTDTLRVCFNRTTSQRLSSGQAMNAVRCCRDWLRYLERTVKYSGTLAWKPPMAV